MKAPAGDQIAATSKMGFLSLACSGLCGCALLLTARLAYAEAQFRRDTIPSIQSALRLDRAAPPAEYSERLAELDPRHAGEWLERALLSNPRRSDIWIDRGLEAERRGQLGEAQADLRKAARIDRQYLPAWTLANFYFRQDDESNFWPWARRAAALAYDDPGPLLALGHALEPDPLAVLQKLGSGDRVARADLDYLIGAGRLDAAQQVARLLLARKSPSDRPRLTEMTERQIRAGNAGYALELANALSHQFELDTLNPAQGRVLTNGSFLRAPAGNGFDWRLQTFIAEWKPSQLTLWFSGAQPETSSVLEQILPLDPRLQRYQLRFEYRSVGLASNSGLRWDLDGEESDPLQSSDNWREETTVFQGHRSSPTALRLSRLRLIYRRDPGTVRSEGRLELRHLQMEGH